jgi:DNA repair photolyase
MKLRIAERYADPDPSREEQRVEKQDKVYEEIVARQTMNRVRADGMPFGWSINPYRGCVHGCSFCYARPTHSYLGLDADETFQNHILLKRNADEALEAQLARMLRSHRGDLRRMVRRLGVVTIGTATDPYQAVEARAQLTRKCLKVLAKYRIPVSITTRSPLILRDLDLLKEMRVQSVNISVNTLDTRVWRNMEPASPHPWKRLETVRVLVEHGLHAGIFLAPILPFLTDREEDLDKVLRAAKESSACFVVPSVLRLAPAMRSWYFQVLQRHEPHLVARYELLYRSSYPRPDYTETVFKRVRHRMDAYGLVAGPRNGHGEAEEEEAWAKGLNETRDGVGFSAMEQLSFPF